MQTTKTNISVEVEELSPVKKKINITVPGEIVKTQMKAAFKDLRATTAIAGFRKGAAPVSILKKRYGGQVYQDVSARLIEMSYPHALQEKEIRPVENPKIDIKPTTLDEGDFIYSATVEVNPHIELGDGYKGMTITSQAVEVTDKDMEDGLKGLRESRAQYKEAGRPARAEDLLVVDAEGFIDGKAIPNSKITDYSVVLGKGALLKGIEEALTGMSKGETKETGVTFPENYGEKSLEGKTASFRVTVKDVKEKSVPEIDAEFAKDVGCDSVEALNAKVREELLKAKEETEKERVKNEILDKLLDKYRFEVPEALVNKYFGVNINRILGNMRQGIFAPGDRELDSEGLKTKYRMVALRQVTEDTILDAIAAKENLQISDDESDDAIRHLAEARHVSFESLKSRVIAENAMEVIRDGLKHQKVFDLIIAASKKD